MEALVANPQDVSDQFGQLFNYFHKLEEFQETVISLLPFATDDQLEETKLRAMAMGNAGWRIVCACDAVILTRTAALKGGRGRKDDCGEGRMNAARERGKIGGYSDAQVRRNAQIFNTFKTLLINQHSLLDEKGYYEQALRTPKPLKTIKRFEKEKVNNPTFSVTDAAKLARELRERPEPTIEDVKDYLDPNLKSFLLEVEASLVAFSNRCPRPEFKVRIDSWIRATRFERGRTAQSDYRAVKIQVNQGACTVEEIGEEVYLSPAEIKGFCVQLVGCPVPTKEEDPREAGTPYEWRAIGVNTEMAKGSRTYGIFRKDALSGNDFEMPGYRPKVEYGDEDEEHF